MTFTQFLRTKQAENSAIGDFARDWLADSGPHQPKGCTIFGPILRYLKNRGASNGALEVGRQAFYAWQETTAV